MANQFDRLSAALAGRYRLERDLGTGGMATVYLAEDLKHHRKVAIKVLKPDLAAALGPARFLREIEIAAQLSHPHILPLHDSGEAAGFLYYVMPYVEGESLRERLNREKQIPIEDALQIGCQVASALDHAHRHDVIHRDIKPENILLHEGQALLADFGIALAVSRAGRLTDMGLAVGTPDYMSPEQASGERELDARSDVYSLGCVLYEMLTGRLLVRGTSAGEVREARSTLKTTRRKVPSHFSRIVSRCLEPARETRYRSAGELLKDLDAIEALLATRRVRVGVLLRRPGIMAGMIALGLAIVAGGVWLWVQQSRAHWARTVALPEATHLIEQGRNYPAFRLLRQAARYLPGDPVLQELLMESTVLVTVSTTPPAAQVQVRDFFDEPEHLELLGRAPLRDVRLPWTLLVWRVSLAGYQTQEVLVFTGARTVQFALQPASDLPAGMVHVPGGGYELFSTGPVQLEDYWIDRYEVTSRQFKEFIDRGGYERREYWTEPLAEDGGSLSWEQAQRLFRDRTGRPGPATWELSTYPDGHEDYPVGGVSWYEAAAYCAAAGEQLPTVYHWYKAAALEWTAPFAALSRFSASGPAPVGHRLTMGSYGTYDMAGNVKEWTWNQADEDRRYILGGGWNEPSYQFSNHDAQGPFDREETYGFRCAKHRAPLPPQLLDPIPSPFRDYRAETPVRDEVFAVYESLYRYEPTPLDPRVESVDDGLEHWRTERVSFAAAYGNERVPALLFLPKAAVPPYQTIVYFPGAGAFLERPPFNVTEIESSWFLFLLRSGRAVLFPVYRGAYERHIGRIGRRDVWRDVMIHAAKDLQRAVDYLETRADIDAGKLAFFGLSSGAGAGPIMTAIEPRFKASILLGAGLLPLSLPPESDPFNFLPRVTVPTLMINGRHDFFFPLETSQVPMFRWLGTPPADKRHRRFESGHVPTERQEVMKEILDWLDQYLGAVDRP